ncbi:MAG: nickel insertion protein [Syntrophobacteraceae bacterium]
MKRKTATLSPVFLSLSSVLRPPYPTSVLDLPIPTQVESPLVFTNLTLKHPSLSIRSEMNIVYFDCFSGISGDMTLGALVDLGVPIEALIAEMGKLPLENWSMEGRRERRGAVEGMRVVISAQDQPHRKYSDIRAMLQDSALDRWVREKSLAGVSANRGGGRPCSRSLA